MFPAGSASKLKCLISKLLANYFQKLTVLLFLSFSKKCPFCNIEVTGLEPMQIQQSDEEIK